MRDSPRKGRKRIRSTSPLALVEELATKGILCCETILSADAPGGVEKVMSVPILSYRQRCTRGYILGTWKHKEHPRRREG